MNIRIFNISLAIFWFTLFLGLITREIWMPPWLLAKAETPQTPLVIGLTAMLTMWNFSKFWVSRYYSAPKSRITPEMREKIQSITGVDHKVTDPQFKFDDADSPSPG
ncbi:hypothetical protein [Zavarzinella formosa]|uniref:hypothetical protein n=1 Tax=Zavarzinella formosa TaxID=360055 RepID=UPI0002D4D61E|nr:hypothetical protein [Zavarzinella formosa]